MKHLPHIIAACAALLIIPGAQAGTKAPGAPPAREVVTLTGWLQAFDMDMEDVALQVEANGQQWAVQVTENGRFTVSVPADQEVTLRFEKPGHVPKEVLLDTRNALGDARWGKQRRVRMGVVLEAERHMAGLVYQGPVGSLSFDPDGGCLAVDHHRQTVPAKQRRTMVF